MNIDKIIIRRPDDFHAHLREGRMLRQVLPYHNIFGRVMIIGNLNPLVETAQDVSRYNQEIMDCDPLFEPVMSVMLTENTTPKILREARAAGAKVLKMIPRGVSTNADTGVDISRLKQNYPIFEEAQRLGMIFSGHWELLINPETGKIIPERFRETYTIPYFIMLVDDFPGLKIIVEHVTTIEMIKIIEVLPSNVAATITAHHPLLTIDMIMKNEKIINPLCYCKSIPKSNMDLEYLIQTIISGNPKFFFGSDSAPHYRKAKEHYPPAAGIFTAPVALPLLTQIFADYNALYKLGDFTSRFGAEFYGLPLNQETVTLVCKNWVVPREHKGVPIFKGGETLNWQIAL